MRKNFSLKSIVFAEFPEWKSLSADDKNAIFKQACELWQSGRGKAEQLFDYLLKNQFDSMLLEKFAREQADGDFALFYAGKFLDPGNMKMFDLAEAQEYVNLAIEKGCSIKADYKNHLSDAAVSMITEKLETINQQLADCMYAKNDSGEAIFCGEECAVLDQYGAIQYLKKDFCAWDLETSGLILARDEPVELKDVDFADFPPELAVCLANVKNTILNSSGPMPEQWECFPNIIDLSAWFDVRTFDDLVYLRKLELQLLAHGYSLVNKSGYMLEKAQRIAPGTLDTENKHLQDIVAGLPDENDDDDIDIDKIFADFEPYDAEDNELTFDFSDLWDEEEEEEKK